MRRDGKVPVLETATEFGRIPTKPTSAVPFLAPLAIYLWGRTKPPQSARRRVDVDPRIPTIEAMAMDKAKCADVGDLPSERLRFASQEGALSPG